jgi:ATP-dependent helicase HrpA
MEKIALSHRQASRAISEVQDMSVLHVLAAEKSHIADLMRTNILSTTGLKRITRIPVYLQAIKMRIEKLLENPERDRIAELELNEALALVAKAPSEKADSARWLLEELRVSLFAQVLGTSEPVSVQRIRKALTSN